MSSSTVTTQTLIPVPPIPVERTAIRPAASRDRNQAPGIVDRRKSVLGDRSLSRGSGRSKSVKAPKARGRMSDVTPEPEKREDPAEELDTFEDATDTTPRQASSAAPENHGESMTVTGQTKGATSAVAEPGSGEGQEEEARGRSRTLSQGQTIGLALSDFTTDSENIQGPGTVDGVSDDAPAAKRPPSTSHQFFAARMGDKDLGSGEPTTPNHSRSTTLTSIPDLAPKLPPRDSRSASPVKGLSGNLPPVNYPPPPSGPAVLPSPQSLSRKVSSPFGWLSRNMSIRKATSPPLPAEKIQPLQPLSSRRNTASSMATLGSNPDLMLSTIEDGNEDGPPTARSKRLSLRDRFQQVRMQEESGAVDITEDGSHPGRTNSVGNILTSLKSAIGDGDDAPPMVRSSSLPRTPVKSAPVNSSLPPGTAAGVATGPAAEDATPVDWNLWQDVVYEGPAAVARTSGDELSQAIVKGIPQPIRGVVWQVLAESKNEELESMYRELVARGADKERRSSIAMPRTDGTGLTNGTQERESIASSASSVHSDTSTPATNAANGSLLSSQETGTDDALAKLQATLAAEKKQRKVRDGSAAITKLEKAIKRDMGARTSYSKYLMSAGLQDGLFGVCKAYALFDEGVGYAQGMNFIAMPLLFNMSEEEAFTLLVRLMSKYDLRALFTTDMSGLHLRLYQFDRLLEDLEPALYCHLHRRGVTPTLYATQWFLTFFAYRFPLQLVLRIYDLILSEGLSAILKFGIVLMQRNRDALLAMRDMSQLTNFLKEKLFDVYIDKSPSASNLLDSGFFGSTAGADKEVYRADEMVRDACAVNVTPERLRQYTAEWEVKMQMDRDREGELETLRTANAALQLRCKTLEERAQQHDTEHVGLASELVRTKVDNEGLRDENEGLRMQVEEMRNVMAGLERGVEERMQREMDGVMKRNIEVQNENRALEEAVQEMETELVGTKMMCATVNEQHDALKQKWVNIQQMINADAPVVK
ncbi:hypothetical protein LTR66_011917 [Elasticomyces elasticus]|nr:hypothetical protein LTR66_011917 [Elasticomyces elasticus]